MINIRKSDVFIFNAFETPLSSLVHIEPTHFYVCDV